MISEDSPETSKFSSTEVNLLDRHSLELNTEYFKIALVRSVTVVKGNTTFVRVLFSDKNGNPLTGRCFNIDHPEETLNAWGTFVGHLVAVRFTTSVWKNSVYLDIINLTGTSPDAEAEYLRVYFRATVSGLQSTSAAVLQKLKSLQFTSEHLDAGLIVECMTSDSYWKYLLSARTDEICDGQRGGFMVLLSGICDYMLSSAALCKDCVEPSAIIVSALLTLCIAAKHSEEKTTNQGAYLRHCIVELDTLCGKFFAHMPTLKVIIEDAMSFMELLLGINCDATLGSYILLKYYEMLSISSRASYLMSGCLEGGTIDLEGLTITYNRK